MQRNAGDDLPGRGCLGGEADLRAEDVVVVVQHRDMPIAQVAMRTHLGIAGVETGKEIGRILQPLRHLVQHQPHAAYVQRRVEITA